MEVVRVKTILAQNLLIYIGLHCVRRSSWPVTTLATLLIMALGTFCLIKDSLLRSEVCMSLSIAFKRASKVPETNDHIISVHKHL